MKQQAITQNLRGAIENFEKLLGVDRFQFNRASSTSYSIGYEWHSTKGVKSSAVYLYKLPRLSNGKKPSIGISFDFYVKSDSYSNRNQKKPLEEQTVRFSYCLDTELPRTANSRNPAKEVFLTEPLYLEEARSVLRAMYKHLKEQPRTSDAAIDTVQMVAFKYEPKNETTLIDAVNSELANPRKKLASLKETAIEAEREYNQALTLQDIDLRGSAEYLKVLQLEAKLKKAKEALTNKKALISENHNVSEIGKRKLRTEKEFYQADSEWNRLVEKTMKKLGLPMRHFEKILKK